MRGTRVKALLYGAQGQLGTAIVAAARAGDLTLECAPRSVDISDERGVTGLLQASQPDWVINCAAMTNVDGAHGNPQLAMNVNAIGPANIARAAKAVGARMIQISTEAVFDGERTEPYSETDVCRPVSVYGVTKLAGEMLVRVYAPDSFVLRTSWLYSGGTGVNFPTRILEQLAAHDESISVVTDVIGNPTPTGVLAEAVLSYVGVGVDPSMNSFGTLINNARLEMAREPMVWWSLAAAFVFMVTLVLAANLFADAVRDAFDPRVRTRLRPLRKVPPAVRP